jgi:hypothetical protein
MNHFSSAGGTKLAVASCSRRSHRPTWTSVESANAHAGHGALSPTVSPGRYVSISRPWSSTPSARGAPSKPTSSRCRSNACTVAVQGETGLWTTPWISTAPVV